MEKKVKDTILTPVITIITTLLLTAGCIIYLIDKFL